MFLSGGGRVYTEIVPDAKAKTPQRIVRGKVSPDAAIHTDGRPDYDSLVDVGKGL